MRGRESCGLWMLQRRWVVNSWVVLALVGASVVLSARVWASNGQRLERAVGVFISERGQKFLHNNFEQILFANGFAIREGEIPDWNYVAREAVSLDRLPPQFEKFNPTFQKIRDLMERWLKGFHLNDPKLAVSVRDIRYVAEFRRLGFRADRKMLRELKRDHAVVLVAEAEIPKLRIDVGSMKAGDVNNPFLGHLGVNGFWTATAPKTEALKIKIPLLVELSQRDGLRVEVLRFTTNLPKVQMGFGFDRPLIIPTVEVIVNGHKMELDRKAIEDDLLKHQTNLVQGLQNLLKGELEAQIPSLLSSLIEKKLGNVSDENEMAPPGAPNTKKPARNFLWGLTPEEVEHGASNLYLGLAGYVEDPASSTYLPIRGMVQGKGTPVLSGKYGKKYDVALALNQGLFNRVLQLSHQRGYFKKVPSGAKGEFIELVEAPVFRFDHHGARDHVKLRLVLNYWPTGLERVAIKGPMRIGFNLDARFARMPDGSTSILMDHLDKDSVEIDKNAIRFDFFEERVLKGVADRIDAENRGMKKSAKSLADHFPVPETLFGVPIVTNGFEVLPNGYLVLYTEFGT